MVSSFWSKIKTYFKKPFKNIFLCGGVFLVLLIGILVFSLKPFSNQGFSFLRAAVREKLPSQELFVEPVKNFLGESPEITFVQENSLVGISSPVMIKPQTLGGLLGGAEPEGETRNEVIEYIVQPGDNLSSIAAKFNISLSTILWANDLNKSSTIKPGQKLVILPTSGVLYLVKKGDTLSGIAKTHKGKAEEIIAFNGLSNEGDIFIGDLLIIPNGKIPATPPRVAQIPLASSYFIFPSEGKISQGLHPFNAIDIANKCGQLVVATAGGKVQRAGPVRVGGNRVSILHPNGVVTYYGHLSAILVKPGETVNAGDPIGRIGNTGFTLGATGCHLHFEVRGAKNFLSKNPVGTYLSWKK